MKVLALVCLCLCIGTIAATFSWSNCGGTTKLVSLSISDPLVLGANNTIAFAASLASVINPAADISASVTLQKSIFGAYVTIPCLDGMGSCNYTNVCTVWDMFLNATNLCPTLQKNHIPCTCDLAIGQYSIPATTELIPNPGISFLADGNFKINISFYSKAQALLGCFDVQFTLSTSGL